MVNLIVAIGSNYQIGLDGKLPWHSPSDLKWFKSLTSGEGKVLVVGHTTYNSLPTLPGRTLYVMKRTDTPSSVISMFPDDELWVIGGKNTYLKWKNHIDRYYISKITTDCNADTYLNPEELFWS